LVIKKINLDLNNEDFYDFHPNDWLRRTFEE